MAQAQETIYQFGDYTLEADEHRLKRHDEDLSLQPKTFEVLLYLVKRQGHLVKKQELLDALWPDSIVTENALTRCIKEVRKALGDDASHPSYIQTVSRVGYKFIAEVEELTATEVDQEEEEEEYTAMSVIVTEEGAGKIEDGSVELLSDIFQSAPSELPSAITEAGRPQRFSIFKFRSSILGLLGLLLLAGLAADFYLRPTTVVPPPSIKSMVVLPFKPLSSDESDTYLGFGMADTLITRLSGTHQLIVRPTSAIFRYVDKPLEPMAAGREQKVDVVMEGTIQRSGEKIRVTVRLLSVQDGTTLWAYKCDDQLCTDPFAVQDTISQEVAQALTLKLTGQERAQLTKRETENRQAYDAYLKGHFYSLKLTPEGVRKGIEYFQQAIALDPQYARAYSGLGRAYHREQLCCLPLPTREAGIRIKEALERALQLDDRLAEAYAMLGLEKLSYEWDWAGAEIALKRAIELDPNEMLGHFHYALYLVSLGQFDEAVAEAQRASELDPLAVHNAGIGNIFTFARRYDLAMSQLQKTIDMHPNFFSAHEFLGLVYELKGMDEEAAAEYEKASLLSGRRSEKVEVLLTCAHIAAVQGNRREALQALAPMEELLKGRPIAYRRGGAKTAVASIYARLGEKDKAFHWLEKAYEDHVEVLHNIKVDPRWDTLRSDPRFADLMRRIGVPE